MKNKILASFSLAAVLLTAGCGSQYGGNGYGFQNPYTNPDIPAAQKVALTGGALGAAAGYVIGRQSDRAGEGAALGAALGAVGGYVVGQQKDRQWRNYEQGYGQNERRNPYQGEPYRSYPYQGPYYK